MIGLPGAPALPLVEQLALEPDNEVKVFLLMVDQNAQITQKRIRQDVTPQSVQVSKASVVMYTELMKVIIIKKKTHTNKQKTCSCAVEFPTRPYHDLNSMKSIQYSNTCSQIQ